MACPLDRAHFKACARAEYHSDSMFEKPTMSWWAVQDLNLWPLPCQGADPPAQEALLSL